MEQPICSLNEMSPLNTPSSRTTPIPGRSPPPSATIGTRSPPLAILLNRSGGLPRPIHLPSPSSGISTSHIPEDIETDTGQAHLVSLAKKALQHGEQLCTQARTTSNASAQSAVDVLALDAKIKWMVEAVVEQLRVCFRLNYLL